MTTPNNEKISVIMGIYNCSETLEAAINSILSQTYTDWELILCDDASTDNTYEIAEAYRNEFPDRIILLRNDHNRKLAYSLNHCLKYATGLYVARMDGDDISRPDRFAAQVNYLKTHPEVQLVGTAMQRFNDNEFGAVDIPVEFPDKYTMRHRTPFYHATIMTYKWVYDSLDGYKVEKYTQRSQDWELWFRFYAKGYSGCNILEPLYEVREDIQAIKRRTFVSRCRSFRGTIIGYRLLNYPFHWYIAPTLGLLKGLVPSKLVWYYRCWQKKRGEKRKLT